MVPASLVVLIVVHASAAAATAAAATAAAAASPSSSPSSSASAAAAAAAAAVLLRLQARCLENEHVDGARSAVRRGGVGREDLQQDAEAFVAAPARKRGCVGVSELRRLGGGGGGGAAAGACEGRPAPPPSHTTRMKQPNCSWH